MKTIHLIRHAETEANRENIFRGREPVPLSPDGLVQSEELAGHFRDAEIDMVFSSPLSWSMKTADMAFPDSEVIAEDLLININLGQWAGLSKDLVKKQYPEKWEMWVNTPEKLQFPGGESMGDLYDRAGSFLEKLKAGNFRTVAVVTHRSSIKALTASATGVGKDNFYWRFHIDNGSISTIIYDRNRGFTLSRLNYTEHLSKYMFEWT